MKRLISIIVAFLVILSINITAFAADAEGGKENGGGGNGGSRDYLTSFYKWTTQYLSGEMSYSEYTQAVGNFLGDSSNYASKYIADKTRELTDLIGDTVDKYGDEAKELISKWISNFFDDYKVLENTSNFNMKGAGCAILTRSKMDGSYTVCYGYGSGVINFNGTLVIYQCFLVEHYYSSGILNYDEKSDPPGLRSFGSYNPEPNDKYFSDYLYGSWVYADGTDAPTNDEYTESESFNFDNATDEELEDLLDKILEALENNNPDLSSIEGLLKAIYNRLGTLDSDNDNDILNQINASILSLAHDGSNDNTELIQALSELKEAIKNSNGNYNSDYFKDMADYLKDISGTLKGLALIEVSDNLLDLTDSESKLFDAYADLIPLLVKKIGFSVVSKIMTDIEVVIFTSSTPNDLTVNIFGNEYILLSSSMFTSESIRYIEMSKTFVSVILVYLWCMKMRKRLAGSDV